MNQGRTVFAQIMDGIDRTEFERCAQKFPLVRAPRCFSAYDHFASMVFAQVTYRQSLRDIEVCLNARPERLYHVGIRGRVSRSNLAYANTHRSWRVFASVAELLMRRARRLYSSAQDKEQLPFQIFAFDASLMDVSLALCPWAYRQPFEAAVRLNVLLDTATDVPEFASVTSADRHEVSTLDQLPLTPGAFYVMDRGYLDFHRLNRFNAHGAFFLVRGKSNLRFRAICSRKVERSLGLRCDQVVKPRHQLSRKSYPEPLRRIRYFDTQSATSFVFLTNNFELEASALTELYRRRWQVELFFRWIKQHLRLRSFFANSPNGVRVQIWSALCAHLLVAIARQRHQLHHFSLYQILQVVSVCPWEKVPLHELLTTTPSINLQTDFCDLLSINDS
jgi:hypothetical protein